MNNKVDPPRITDVPEPIRIGLVEDNPQTLNALVEILTAAPALVLRMTASNFAQAQRQLRNEPLDVLLVDLGLPDGSGLDLIRMARLLWPHCAVMVSTIFGDEEHVISSIEAGATGYLLKDANPANLVNEILSLHAGGSPISPMVARKILRRALPFASPESALLESLSTRETEVLKLIGNGFTAEEVAQKLLVSRSTIQTFIRRIYAKLQVSSRAEVIHVAHQQGLLGHGD